MSAPGPRPTRKYRHDKEKHQARREMVAALNDLVRRGESLGEAILLKEKRRQAEQRCVRALMRLALPYQRACRHCLESFYSLSPNAAFCKPAHKVAFRRRQAKARAA